MKRILFLFIIFCAFKSYSQTKTVINTGSKNQIIKTADASAADSMQYLPTACDTPSQAMTQRYQSARKGAMIMHDSCHNKTYIYFPSTNTWTQIGSSGGGGTVTNFSSGDLSPLFTTSVATSTTTPALTFALTNASGGTVFGNNSGSTTAPSYTANPKLGRIGTNGTLDFVGATSGDISILPQVAAGTYNFNLPTTAGTSGYFLTSAGGGSSAMTWTSPTTTSFTRQVITSGTSATVTGGNYIVTIDPASALSVYTLTMAASPSDLDILEVDFGGTLTSGTIVTALTISANSGQTILDNTPPVSATADNTLFYRYRTANTTWYRYKP